MSTETIDDEVLTEEQKELMVERYHEIARQAMLISTKQGELAVLMSKYKAMKKGIEAEQQILNELILDDVFQRKLPLAVADDESQRLKPKPSIEWRSLEITALLARGVSPKKVQILQDAGLSHLGDLQDIMVKSGEFWSADIKGIGGVAKTAIEDAMNAIVMEAEADPAPVEDDDEVIDGSFEIIPDEKGNDVSTDETASDEPEYADVDDEEFDEEEDDDLEEI